MDLFYRWLIGDMGVPGDYMYGIMHLICTVIVVLLTVVLAVWAAKMRGKIDATRKMLAIICTVQAVFEVVWRLVYFFIKNAPINELWPHYPCNLGGVLLPIIGLLNWKTGKKLFYLFGFVGGVLTFALPDGIFSTSVFVFPILKSVMQHTGLLLIPVLELASGTYRPSLKDFGWVVAGCCIHAFNCEVIDRWFGLNEDYMFFRSDMPFVIEGVPQFITLSVFALLVFALLCFLCDIKGSIKWLKEMKKPAV